MNIMLEATEENKQLISALRSGTKPPEAALAGIRALKPGQCPHCKQSALQGHGWRRRTVWQSPSEWRDWWCWRLFCAACRKVCQLVPAAVCCAARSSLLRIERILRQPAGRAERQSQRRWLERLDHWWPPALAAGAAGGTLEEQIPRSGWLKETLVRAARHGIALLAPAARSGRQVRTWDGAAWRPAL